MSSKKPLVKFAPKGTDSFYDAIKIRVEDYFVQNKIDKTANTAMKVKTIAMLCFYFIPYVLIVTGVASMSLWIFYGLWLVMGIGIVGIGTSVMHDSNHGAYSQNAYVNSFLGNLLNILGGYSRNWRIQHNILHHTYTNLDGLDEDIEAGFLLRMSPNRKQYRFHRYQHIYAWFLYMIMNLFWVTVKDYRQIFKYEKEGLLRKEKISLKKAIWELSGIKLFYITYIIVLPILFSQVAWYQVVLGFTFMHLTAGLGLACVFQPAHVVESSTFPEMPATQKMEDSWAVHQILNTANFSPGSHITAWFIGGLNYQIEHHLFPQICHIHYPKIAPIIAQTAREYNLPYHVQKTFVQAIWEHGRMLYLLGRPIKPSNA